MNFLANLGRNSSAWIWLLLSAFFLEIAALYFQYAMELRPCIMCIYQRTAVFGIMFAAIIPLLTNNIISRMLAYVLWGVSAVWGLVIALEHVEIQSAKNSFFATCEIVPNFPSWAPLHEWLPNIFAATGDCGDIDWSFLSLTMPQWMTVIFALYTITLTIVLSCKVFNKKAR
ncbi:disulfide bond formation protein DsbB [Paraglaciecola sp.]|uniref:disulfide bond formation protein DsbB n=1 Tax=Paraglaciecola sp. TaxID=1920173 RepID=UPI0030F3E918